MSPDDLDVLSAGIVALGGQWRRQYGKGLTHIFTLHDGSDDYKNAIDFREETGIKVVVPHWFDDSVKLGVKDLDPTPYEWPAPPILKRGKQKQSATKKSKTLGKPPTAGT